MAYVPDRKHDVFVSYAHVDNLPAPDVEDGWVTALVKQLQVGLVGELGSRECDVWVDMGLEPNIPFTPAIMEALRDAATLLVVMSDGYIESGWCQREARVFLETVREMQESGSRVFVVDMRSVPRERRPPAFRKQGDIAFWVRADEPGSRNTNTLGWPTPGPEDRRWRQYHDRVDQLAQSLARTLKTLKGLAPGEDIGATAPDQRTAVLLARVTDDLVQEREQVRRYLDQRDDLRVLPEAGWYPFDQRVHFEETMRMDLDESMLFVQLLGPLVGERPPWATSGRARLQYDLAKRAGVPTLQWRSRDLDVDAVQDADQRALLELETVHAVGIEEFKSEVVSRVDRLMGGRDRAEPCSVRRDTGRWLVFVDSNDPDAAQAEHVREALKASGADVASPLGAGTAAEIRQDLECNLTECDAAIIVSGGVSVGWVNEQLRLCRKMLARRERPLKALAVLEVPPGPEASPSVELKMAQVLDCRGGVDAAKLSEFLQTLD